MVNITFYYLRHKTNILKALSIHDQYNWSITYVIKLTYKKP